MKKLGTLCTVTLTAVLLVAPVVGCQQPPQPEVTPTLAIMVESNIVEAGSSFMVSGSNFKPKQWVFADFEYRASNRRGGITAFGDTDEQGSIHLIIEVPDDVIPGDYEVNISTGSSKRIEDRQLLTTLPIHIQVGEE